MPTAHPEPAREAVFRRSSRPVGKRLTRGTIPKLSIVIVNYCQWEETAALTRHLLASDAGRRGTIEVVIVDNHSPGHRLIRRLRRWPGVSLRRWKHNRGFARAVNEGCRLSRGRWLLLLNPDVTLGREFIEGVLALTDRLGREDSRAGVVGFRLRNGDGSRQLSTGSFPTLPSTLARVLLPRCRRKYSPPPEDGAASWVTGCCLMLRRACLDGLGGFDEDFFLYYEDVDLCRRARARGWDVRFEPSLQAVHHRPLHSRALTVPLRIVTRHALLTYGAKHWGRWEFRVLAALVRAEAWLRRRWAALRGDHGAAARFDDLRAIARDLIAGRRTEARRRLDRIVRREEHRIVA